MTASAPTASAGARSTLEDGIRRWGLVAVVIGLVALFAAIEPAFASVGNAFSILRSIAIVTIIASAVTLSLVIDGFDLSVGANAGLAMMLASIALVVWRLDALSAVAVALIGGLAVGALNALLVVRLRIPDLLATLAVLFVIQGFQLIITGGRSVATGMRLGDGTAATGVFTPDFLWLGRGTIGPVPVPVLITVVVVVLLHLFLTATRHGRAMEAVGANREATRLAGIRVDRYRAAAYLGSGALAALGGVVLAAQVGRGDVGAGGAYLLDAVGAALIGLAAFGTNRPSAIGTALGAVFVGVLLNGLTMANLPYYAQDLVKGGVLAAALIVTFALGPGRRR
jgi:simple sugar transport system permease protein